LVSPAKAALPAVLATISGSMSSANTLPETCRAAGMVNVPKPQPNSTTSPHGPVQSSLATIHPGSKNVSQADSSGIPLSRPFIDETSSAGHRIGWPRPPLPGHHDPGLSRHRAHPSGARRISLDSNRLHADKFQAEAAALHVGDRGCQGDAE